MERRAEDGSNQGLTMDSSGLRMSTWPFEWNVPPLAGLSSLFMVFLVGTEDLPPPPPRGADTVDGGLGSKRQEIGHVAGVALFVGNAAGDSRKEIVVNPGK